MKKKMLLVAVAISALTLGACVDDNESQSVTDVRTAKAEALKAVAALDNAKAAAETTMAEAQAEWYKAQAEYEKAKAAAENAKAALKQQKKEQAAQEFALQIQKIEAETNKAIAEAKAAIANYESQVVTTNNTKLNTLYANYSVALNNLMNLNNQLTTTKASIAYLEAGVDFAKAFAKTQVTNYERDIAGYNAQIAILKDPAYTNIDNKEMYAKWQAADKKSDLAWNTLYANEGVAAKAAGDAVKTAYNAIDMSLIYKVNSIYGVIGYTTDGIVRYVTDIYRNDNNLGYLYKYFRVNETTKLAADRSYTLNVTNKQEILGTSADTKDKTTAYGKLAAANAAMTAAKELPETTDAEKATKKAAIENAETAIATAKDNLATAQINYDEAIAEQKTFDDAFAAIDIAAYNKASDDLVAAIKKQETAIDTYDKALQTPNKLNAEATALQNLYYNTTNIDEQIANLESNIAEANKEIAKYSANGSYLTDSEVALAEANKKVENLTAEIAAQSKIVNAAKAALDAALAE